MIEKIINRSGRSGPNSGLPRYTYLHDIAAHLFKLADFIRLPVEEQLSLDDLNGQCRIRYQITSDLEGIHSLYLRISPQNERRSANDLGY